MTDADHALAVETLADGQGMEIVDRIEQERCQFRTAGGVTPRPAATDAFRFPVDRATAVTTDAVGLPNVAGILVRDESGSIVAQVQRPAEQRLPAGSYDIELLTQFKTYVRGEGPLEIVSDATEFRIDFGSATDVVVGARSNHDSPATTVTTTESPVDMMGAVETFGSALKTLDPDRSFPSLRGHPPAVELGDQLAVPSAIQRPESGITLELPARHDAVYVAAPLAYYLGARVEPGPTPRLVTDDGFEHRLAGPEGFEASVERTLKQVFFLDCLTRTEGLYEIDLHERTAVERLVEFDFEALYEQSIQQQVATYLDVPYSVVAEYVPDWRLTTHVEPVPETIEQVPFVVDDLAVVRTRSSGGGASSSGPAIPDGSGRDVLTRSADGQTSAADVDYVEPRASDSLEQAWIGDDIPIGASKLTREAFQNRLDRSPVEGDISITIVLNDARMDEERDLVDRAYGNRDSLPFEVDIHRDVATEELRALLGQDAAFLHYIGHTERDGFECTDGKLDARTLSETGVQSFLLNACNSYEQGLGLIQAGAVGGIVTLNDVINEGAVRIGETVARLLDAGFPLRAALTIAREESVLGGQYIVVGDGGMTVAQPASGTPILTEIQRSVDGFDLEIQTFTTDVTGLGTVFKPHIENVGEYFLSSGAISEFTLDETELRQFLQMEETPVRVDGELHWSSSLQIEQIEQ